MPLLTFTLSKRRFWTFLLCLLRICRIPGVCGFVYQTIRWIWFVCRMSGQEAIWTKSWYAMLSDRILYPHLQRIFSIDMYIGNIPWFLIYMVEMIVWFQIFPWYSLLHRIDKLNVRIKKTLVLWSILNLFPQGLFFRMSNIQIFLVLFMSTSL